MIIVRLTLIVSAMCAVIMIVGACLILFGSSPTPFRRHVGKCIQSERNSKSDGSESEQHITQTIEPGF
jgi:hypothetical protein